MGITSWMFALAWAALVLAQADAPPQEKQQQTEIRTKVLPGNGWIRYEVEPGDDEKPAGELVVMHFERPPAATPAQLEERQTPPIELDPQRNPCAPLLGKLLARMFQLRGIDVDPRFAEWLERNLTLGSRGIANLQIAGESMLLSAVKTDLIARSMAEDVARCEMR